MAVKAERLKALVWDYVNKSSLVPTAYNVQAAIQKQTGTLYSIDVISRYLCEWYAAKERHNKARRYVRLQQLIDVAIKALRQALETLESIQKDDF